MAKRQNGEGSWGKKKIGKYTYQYFRDSDGKYFYGKTVKEVKEKVKEYNNSKFSITDKTTFGEYVQNWLLTKQSSVEPSTYDCYETMIKTQITEFKGYDIYNQQLKNITSEKWQKYLDALSEEYARSSIEKMWRIIRQCVDYAEVQGDMPPNTTKFVKVPLEANVKVKKKDVPFLSTEDANKLYNAVKESRFNNGQLRYKNNYNAHAIIFVMYSGVRVSEMTAIKWKNVDIENKTIIVKESTTSVKNRDDNSDKKYITYDKIPKTESGYRKIPLPNRAMEMIEWFESKNKNHTQNDYVFVTKNKTQINRRNINKTLKSLAKIANTDVQDFAIHTLRHTYGSILLENGVDIKKVSELLGHKDISTTYNIYIGVLEKDKKSEVERVFN